MLVKHGKPLKKHAQFHHVYRCYVLCLPFSENWHCFRPHILHPWPGLWAQLPRNRERPRWSVILLETLLLDSRTGENVREAKPPKFTGAMDWWVVVSRFNPFRRLMNKTWNHQNRSTDGLTQSFHAFASHMWNESAASNQVLVHLGVQRHLLGILRKGGWVALGRRPLTRGTTSLAMPSWSSLTCACAAFFPASHRTTPCLRTRSDLIDLIRMKSDGSNEEFPSIPFGSTYGGSYYQA